MNRKLVVEYRELQVRKQVHTTRFFFQYTEWFLHGKQNPRPYVKIVKSGRSNQLGNSAVSIIDADGGLGLDHLFTFLGW